ncbi:TetR/AcrR family transcriptional regulator [Paenibacillus motobuensis]|uniref:TetR/AcrR family transcriptional regulator n=1 Tax=Paenibacillus motobuensis TaxID=295324 RepID=A0ABP3I8X1_9BACL
MESKGAALNKKQLQSEQTKRRVADAARALFVNKGYKATSIEDISEATGSSKGNIYYHFKSKEGLFLYLLDEWEQEWEVKWQENVSHYKTVTDKLYGFAKQMVLDDLNHPLSKAASEFFNHDEKPGDVEERIIEMVQGHLKFNQDLLQQGIDNGEFKAENIECLAIILESLVIGLSHMSRQLKLQNAIQLYQQAIKIYLYGIANPPH